MGDVIWHGRWCLFPYWEVFYGCGPKIIFGHMYISVSPQKHFLNIINLVGIASHITCTFLSDYSINFHVYVLICVFIFDIFTYFCLGMLGIDCRDMAWQIDPSYLTEGYIDIFIGWTSPSGSDIVWNSHLCHMSEYFYIFQHILPHLDAQYHIHYTFITVSYTCAI